MHTSHSPRPFPRFVIVTTRHLAQDECIRLYDHASSNPQGVVVHQQSRYVTSRHVTLDPLAFHRAARREPPVSRVVYA